MTSTSARGTHDADEIDLLTLERAKRGDRAAFRSLVERYQQPVHALASRLLTGSGRSWLVEDLAQETFVRVFQSLPTFGQDGRLRLSSFILTIAARLTIDELRRPQRTDSLDAGHQELAGDSRPDGDFERRDLAQAIARAVETLSVEQRATFLLRELHGFEYEEIATALDADLGTVKSRLSRARQALRAALAEIHDEQ